MSGLTFDDLVAVAALGVSRKGFTAAELGGPAAGYAGILDSGDPAAALLDAAALLTVAGRAGVQPQREVAPPPAAVAATTDGERELSARGARLLARVGGLGRQHGFARSGVDLLGDLLSAMREAGYVLPAPLLPELLDIASRSQALRPLVLPVLGPRGRWLAGHRPDWQQVVGAGPATRTTMATVNREGASAAPAAAASDAGTGSEARAGRGAAPAEAGGEAGTGGAPEAGGPEVWRVGTPSERRAYLAGLRERDPRAGRELLAAGWPREARAERAGLLAAFGRGLSAGDEEFLERALGAVAGRRDVHGLVAGRVTRMLADAGALAWAEAATRFRAALSVGVPPAAKAAWAEGFLGSPSGDGPPGSGGSAGGLLLVHDDDLLGVLDEWVVSLGPEEFIEVLPLLRRTFGGFTEPERAAIGRSARALGPRDGSRAGGGRGQGQVAGGAVDAARAAGALRTVALILDDGDSAGPAELSVTAAARIMEGAGL